MAFILVEKGTRGSGVSTNDVRISKSDKNGCVHVSVPLSMAETLGLQKGDKVALHAGTGEDAGWFRVVKSQTGFAVGRNGDNGKRLKFATAGILRHLTSFPTTTCRHVVSGDALLFEVPARLLGGPVSVAA